MNKQLIERLMSFHGLNIFNPWGENDPFDDANFAPSIPAIRRFNLERHFACNVQYVLIGEAPGWRGCHYSGIPFTSEKQLCEGKIPRVPNTHRLTTYDTPLSEASAAGVWKTLYTLGIEEKTVMWNAFPFHPYEAGNMYTNRKPLRTELLECADILPMVLDLFRGVKTIAVGNVAADALSFLRIPIFGKVRHPAHGGAALFQVQLKGLIK